MAGIISVRDLNTNGYSVRPVSFRGVSTGPEFRVVNVGNLAKLKPAYVAYVLGVDLADLLRRYTAAPGWRSARTARSRSAIRRSATS